MKSPYRRVSILLAMFVAGVTCMGQAAGAPTAPSDDAQGLVKQGQKLNSEGKQDEGEKRIVIDGLLTETKELIAGFWLWQVRSMGGAV